jgi:serine/threonine protein kinase
MGPSRQIVLNWDHLMVSFPCSYCGRMLQVGEELIGRKVECLCGQLVSVTINASEPAASVHSSGMPSPPVVGEETTDLPAAEEPKPVTTSDPETRGDGGAKAVPAKELYDFLAPPQAPGEMGRLGPYRVIKILGAGGMGVVFQAEDPRLKRPVAVKAMKPALASSESARARFTREAIATAAIKHDHIVTIYQVGEDRGVPFLAMEFLEGEALDARLRREGALPVAEVVRIGREVAEGLAAAHQRGLIHRDIKPANIWLEGERRRVKILDFGLARAVAEDAQLTQSGIILGTPAYMAPEQARSEKTDPRSDLFSLGCVLYHLATGTMPFRGKDMMSVLMALAVDTPSPPQQMRAEIPSPLSALIQQLLAKNVHERPASAQEVVQALRQIEEAKPNEARPIPVARVAEPPTVTEATPVRKARRDATTPARKRFARTPCCCLSAVLLFLGSIGGGIVLLALLFWSSGPNTKQAIRSASSVVQSLAPEAPPPQWPPGEGLSLFNGKDLEGWEVVGGGRWSVVGGILRADGKGTGWLASKRSFADLELKLEYRLPVKGNSGVFLRARKEAPPDGRDFLEIQLLDDANNLDFPPTTRNGAVFNEIAPDPTGPAAPAGQWNTLHVRAEGRTIQVWINESHVVSHQTRRPEKKGLLGLQMLGTAVEFQNIRVRDLSRDD